MKLFLVLGLFVSALSGALASTVLNYSGRLVNVDGSPVSGTVTVRFELFYSSDVANPVCTIEKTNVALSQGVFHANLNYAPANCVGSKTLVQVVADKPAPDSLLIRVRDVTNNKTYGHQALNAMPFAILADQAKTLGPMGATTAGQVLRWDGTQWIADSIDEVAAGSIGTPELADNSVTGAKIQDLTITGADVADGSLPQSKITGLAASFTGKENALGASTTSEYLSGDRAWRNFQNDVRATFVGMGYAPIVAGGSILSTDTLVTAIAKLDGRITNAEAAQTDYVSLAGDTMTGPLVLNADPSVALGAATKQYVDAQITAVSAGSSQWSNIAGGINYAAGNVGIGTATPAAKLDVNGGIYGGSLSAVGNSPIYAPNGGVGIIGYPSTAIGVIQSFADAGGTPRALALNPNGGNLGVGTNAPTATLHVNGTVRITGGAPGVGKVLTSDATGLATWEAPAAAGITSLTGDVTGTGPGSTATTIAPGAVTYAKTNFANGEIPKEKINNLVTDLAGKEPVLAAGTTAQYYRGDKTWQPLNTSVVPEVTNLYFTEPRVLGTPLAGFTANTSQVDVTSADSALIAFQKLQSSVNAILTGSVPFENNINLGGFRATNLGAPTAATDAATRGYVDTAIAGVAAGATQWTTVGGGINYGSGNVGVGAPLPLAKLHVVDEGGSEFFLDNYSSTPGAVPSIFARKARGTIAAPSAVQANDLLFVIGARGYEGTGMTTSSRVAIDMLATENWTSTAQGTAINLSTTANGTTTRTSRLRITDQGNVGIGTTTPSQKLHIVSNAQADRAVVVAGSSLDNNWGGGVRLTSFNGTTTRSDIIVSTNGLDLINNLAAPIRFFTNNLERVRVDASGNVGIGTIAPSSALTVHAPVAGGGIDLTATDGVADDDFGLSWKIPGTGHELARIHAMYPSSGSGGTGVLRFKTRSAGVIADRLTISAEGNVGVGTTAPTTRLQVAGSLLLGNGNESCGGGSFAGAIRYVSGVVEFCNGVAWTALASAGGSTPADNTVTSAKIADGSIVDADVAAGAAIAQSKISNLTSDLAGKQPLDAQLTALAAGDVSGALGFMPINKAGDSMPSGVFDFNTSSVVRVLSPIGLTDVANKQYVDAQVSGAANQWTQSAGNVYRTSGNVGVGTISPTVPLEVTGVIRTSSNIPSYSWNDVDAAADNRLWHMRSATNGTLALQALTDAGTGGGNTMAFTRTGNLITSFQLTNGASDPFFGVNMVTGSIGVGVAAPGSRFHVTQTADDAEVLRSSRNTSQYLTTSHGAGGNLVKSYSAPGNAKRLIFDSTTDGTNSPVTAGVVGYQFRVMGNDAIIIREDGNMGVGVMNPGEKLSVAGVIESTSGGFKFPDGTVQTTSAYSGVNNSMISGWPDAISCTLTNPNYGKMIFYHMYSNYPADGRTYYRAFAGSTPLDLAFTFSTKAFSGYQNITSTVDCAASIDTHYANNRAFNFNKGPAAQWLQNGSSAYYNAGSVGVGTSTPQATLDVNGTVRLAKNAAQPAACSAANDGTIALTSSYVTCVCRSGMGWVRTTDGETACSWTTSGSTGLGVAQTWQNVTGSRGYNTTYTNSTSKPIYVSVSVYQGSTSGGNVFHTINGVEQTHLGVGTNNGKTVTFIVPPGGTYSMRTDTTYTINSWFELR